VVAGAVVTLGTGISIASGLSTLSMNVAKTLNQQGYVTLRPGERHQYGKMSLSLWQQCHCVRSRQEGNDIVVSEVYMRPIFSGAWDGSNNDHTIAGWVSENGHTEVSRHTVQLQKH